MEREFITKTWEFIKKLETAINKRIFAVKNGEVVENPETRFNYGLKRVKDSIDQARKKLAKIEKDVYIKNCVVHEKGDLKDTPILSSDGKSFTFTIEGQKTVDKELEEIDAIEVEIKPFICDKYVSESTKLTLTEINLFRGIVISEEKADELDSAYDEQFKEQK